MNNDILNNNNNNIHYKSNYSYKQNKKNQEEIINTYINA